MFPANFVIGAAVGAVATYIYKDEPAKQKLIETGKRLKEGTGSLLASFRKKPEAEETVELVTEDVPASTIVEEAEQAQETATAKA